MSEAGTTVAAVMARYFSEAGIRLLFGYPGDPNIELLEQCRRHCLQFVLARREGTAAFMADAFGQLTGLPGVCISTLGPGSTNLVNGVATALLDRTPMLAISGQMGARREPTFSHQYIDHNRLFAPVAKWVTRMVPEAAGTIMRKALRVATAERPGPVHISTATDVLKAEARDAVIRLPPMRATGFPCQTCLAPGHAKSPRQALLDARRPILLAGIGALRCDAGPSLLALAERAGLPIVVSPKAKGIVPEDHPYFAGTIDMACSEIVWEFLRSADLIVAAGFDCVELIKDWSLPVPVVHIDTIPNVDQIYPADIELVGDVSCAIFDLADEPFEAPRWTEAEVARQRSVLLEGYYEGRLADRLNPTDVVDAVRQAMPRDTIVTTDVGSHKLLVGQGWAAYSPRSVLMTNGLSSMGFALPGAIAASLIHLDRPVVCFTGDGGFAMVQSELQLASSLGLGVLVVVFCDNTLHRIELKQMAQNYPSWGTRFEPSNIVGLAEAMGACGVRVESRAELESVLGQQRPADRPLVIEAKIDPSQYNSQF